MIKIPDYEIVDFVYLQLEDDEDAFKDEEILKEKIKKLDTKDVLTPWLSGNWQNDINEGKGSTRVSLGSRIQDRNETYIADIQRQIADANRETVDRIRIDEEYQSGTVETLKSDLDERKRELSTLEDVEDIVSGISKAESYGDLPELPSRSELTRSYGREGAEKIFSARDRKTDELDTFTEEYQRSMEREISTAEIGELDALASRVRRDAPTIDSERYLIGQINRRRSQLE